MHEQIRIRQQRFVKKHNENVIVNEKKSCLNGGKTFVKRGKNARKICKREKDKHQRLKLILVACLL